MRFWSRAPKPAQPAMQELKERLPALAEQLATATDAAASRRFRPSPSPANNRALFIDAMADPAKRHIAFNVVERNCRARLAEGEEGIKLYVQLLTDVQRAQVDEAVNEFERRFFRCSIRPLKTKIEQTKKG